METISFNLIQLLILFGSIQGIIFSCIVIFVKKYQSKSSTFLGLTVFLLSISNIQHMLIDVNYLESTSIIRRAYIPWQWLVSPMFYLFIHYFLKKKVINKKLLLLFIGPFFIITIVHFTQLVYHLYFDINYEITDYYQRGLFLYTNALSFIYVPIVIYLIYKMILNYENDHKDVIEKIREETNWLKSIIHIGIVIMSIGIISVSIAILVDANESYFAYPFFVSLSVWIYWVGYVGINRSFSYKDSEQLDENQFIKKTGLTTFNKINTYIIEEKKYLQVSLTLNSIAKKFEISSGYLSQLINTHTKKSFNDYINELRVTTSKNMLLDNNYKNYTIESIGLECGFKSKSNFYTTFKKFSGYTPNQFKNIKETK
ncbi:helix-turn-helix domain-containing protein [Aquimarina sediminis]|uniref:helix-turn-helix domain-containing protein n=1 Tax=Aquimarina sediminis TaxID=2070536 RepID=UPI000FFE3A01|nr:response regulator transcription factor [Aquimarina sediminis]